MKRRPCVTHDGHLFRGKAFIDVRKSYANERPMWQRRQVRFRLRSRGQCQRVAKGVDMGGDERGAGHSGSGRVRARAGQDQIR